MRRAIKVLVLVLLFVTAIPAGAATPSVVTGRGTACILRQDGSVTCWGWDAALNSPPPGPFTQISVGTWSACGLRPGGQIDCWGDSSPAFTPPAGSFLQVDAGDSNHCAVRSDRRVVCWGPLWGPEYLPFAEPDDFFSQVSAGYRNFCGVRLNGTLACNGYFYPEVPTGTFTSVVADNGAADSFCGIRTGGQVACWGATQGDAQVTPPGTFSAVGRGGFHACGLKTDQTLECWGYFGNQDVRQYFPPEGQFTSLAVGDFSSCALRVDGVTVCWGAPGVAPRLEIVPPVIPAAEVGVPYSVDLSIFDRNRDDSPGPYQPVDPLMTTSEGQLPPGFSLSVNGLLEGTAAATGEFPVILLGQDANGFEVERELAFTVVNPGQDVTPPEIEAEITGTNLQLDWVSSDVTIKWIVSDPESGATSQLGCNQLVLTQDTPRRGSLFTCTARSIGGVSSKTVEVRRDATPPNLALSARTLPEDGFFEVTYSTNDVLSTVANVACSLDGGGFASCAHGGTFTIGPLAPGPHTYSVRSTDNAGNDTIRSVPLGPIDTTPPVITPVITGAAGGSGWYVGDVTVSWMVSDAESAITMTVGCGASLVTTDTTGADYTCQATSAGGTTQQVVTVRRDTIAPTTTIPSGPPNLIDFGLPATFNLDGVDAGSGVSTFQCSLDGAAASDCSTPHQIGALPPGEHTMSVLAIDVAGNADLTPATYTWVVSSSGDTTPPIVNAAISGTLGLNGWYRSNVSLTWSWSDPESAILSTTGCTSVAVNRDTSGVTYSCRVSSGGGITERTVTIQRDATPPQTRINKTKQTGLLAFNANDALSGGDGFECSIDEQPFTACTWPFPLPVLAGGQHTLSVRASDLAGNVDPTPDTYVWSASPIDVTPPVANPAANRAANQYGWNSTDVIVMWNWTDSGSGLSQLCPKTTRSQGEGVQVLSATCLDLQGNKTTASYTIRVDKTKPALGPFVAIGPVILNANVTAVSNATDSISGIATESCETVSTAAAGKHTIQCAATDRAGNSAKVKIQYTVAYLLQRYNTPWMSPPMVNQVRQGVVPLRFRLVDANGAPVSLLKGGQFGILREATSTSNCTNATPNPVTETVSRPFALRYLGDGNYEGVISVTATPGSCSFISVLSPVATNRILVNVLP